MFNMEKRYENKIIIIKYKDVSLQKSNHNISVHHLIHVFSPQVMGMLAIARPYRVCREIDNIQELQGHIVILERGDCMFVDKVSD